MKRLVIGTAGHIDHGKTALVRALTGVDTDRLKEEKRRGITIELGFARLELPGGLVAGLVDVPGHERFVKAMVAGAGGIDLVVLVVAADEGVMPQTREHVDICRLLGVRSGLIALTKSDLLPELGEEWLALVEAELTATVRGTFLEGQPVLQVSARTGEGTDALKAELARLAASAPERPVDGPAYLPLDRAFTLKGFGTVVTGTLLHGTLRAGEDVDLAPGGPSAVRIRSLQVHGRDALIAQAGQRTAVNLPGVEVAQVARGMVLTGHEALLATSLLDVELENLASAERPLKARQKLLCHLGTAVVACTSVLLDRAELPPGERGFAQLRLGRPLVALPGQRFILRGFTPLAGRGRTAAGGTVLAVMPRKRLRRKGNAVDGLALLRDGDVEARLSWLLEDAGLGGLREADLARRTALAPKVLAQALSVLGAKGAALLFDRERRAFVGGEAFVSASHDAAELILRHHRENPLATGIPKEELRQRLSPVLDPRLFQKLLTALAEGGRAIVEGDAVRSTGHASAVKVVDTDLRVRLSARLAEAGLSPPTTAELARELGVPLERTIALLKLLVGEGRAVRVKDDLYFDGPSLKSLRERLVGHLRSRREITTQEFKELTGATRKFTIPLGEFFDHDKVTLRLGDKRVLRGEEG